MIFRFEVTTRGNRCVNVFLIRRFGNVKRHTVLATLVSARVPGCDHRGGGQTFRRRITLLTCPETVRIGRCHMTNFVDVHGIQRRTNICQITSITLTKIIGISGMGLELSLMTIRIIGRVVMDSFQGIEGLVVVTMGHGAFLSLLFCMVVCCYM